MIDKATKADNLKRRQHYERLRDKLILDRSSYDRDWRELGDYILPRRTRFIVDDQDQDKQESNGRRNNKIIDSTASRAARALRSGMHAGLTSPARPWMRLAVPDPDLNEFGPVKAWLHTCTVRLLNRFNNSNIYNIFPITYGDMGVFATGAQSILEDSQELIRVSSYPLGSYALGVSRRQVVDTFTMERKMTIQQMIDEFGHPDGEDSDIDWNVFSKQVKSQYDKGNYQTSVQVIWMITPNMGAKFEPEDAMEFPWSSVYWENGVSEGKFLRDSGFREFPVQAPRWEVTGFDTYGSECPGMICLSDVRQLQMMQRRKGQAIEKAINPPVTAPTSLKNQKISLRAGDVTYVDNMGNTQGGMKPINEVNLRGLQFMLQDVQDIRQGINEGFYKDLFLMMSESDRRVITAREVAERHEEKLLMLGPVIERSGDELLDPVVDRTFSMMDRAGQFPPPPKEIQGMSLRVVYTSLFAEAQKLVGVSGVDRFLQSTVPLIETFPIVKYKIRPTAIVDEYAELLGVNPKFVVPDDEANKAFQAEQQQQQKMQQLAQAEQASKAAKNLAGSNLEDDSALTRMLEGVQS